MDRFGSKDTFGRKIIFNDDIGDNIVVGKRGIDHGLSWRKYNIYAATPHMGELLKNTVRINYLVPREGTSGGYVLLAYAEENTKSGNIGHASFIF